jgi:hypothetical protein
MNDAMPRRRPPHLMRGVSLTWIVRVGHGYRTRLRATYARLSLRRKYDAAIRGEAASDPGWLD